MRRLVLAALLGLPPVLHGAPTAYITEKLEVQLRSGPSLQHKILKTPLAGTPLTVLSNNRDNGYSLVRLEDGTQGWILTRFISDQPAARNLLDEATRNLETATEENKQLKTELAALRDGKEGTDRVASRLQSENDRMKTELIAIRQASANALQIQAERDRLQESVIKLERELESIRREKQALDGDYRQDWFLIGAGVLFGGMFLGVILPRLSWRKKNTWNSF